MWRDDTEMVLHERVNFVVNNSALGDMLTSLPAIIHARGMHNPLMKMHVVVPPWQMELVEHLLKPYGEFQIDDFKKFPLAAVERQDWDGGPVVVNSAFQNQMTRNRVPLVDFAFSTFLDARPENDSQRSYPVLAPLGPRQIEGEYVVFPVGATSDNKLFRASVMAPVMQWATENGYKIVVVGTKTSHTHVQEQGKLIPLVLRDEADKVPPELQAAWIDMREKTTLLELRDVLGHAAAVVGTDGGTIHLAGTTDTNIIYALTTTHPRHRLIYRFGDPSHKIRYVMPRNLACAGCQSNWNLMFDHDFRLCLYGDNLCTEKLHPDDFINGLRQLGL